MEPIHSDDFFVFVALWGGIVVVFGVKTVEALPWESQQSKGWALIEVRDSLLPTKKGQA